VSDFFVYKASAGSGKTYALAVEYIKQLLLSADSTVYRNLLAVTFTKEATGEMKDRIMAELYGLAVRLPESRSFASSIQDTLEVGEELSYDQICDKAKLVLIAILHDYNRFYVGTIDAFFQRVLRNLARELGKGSKFNLELNTTRTLNDAVRSLIEKSNQNPELLDWMSRYVEENIEEGKNWRVDKELKSFGLNIFNEYFQEHELLLRKQLEENPKLIAEMVTTHRKLKNDFQKKMTAAANLFFDKNPDEKDFYYASKGIPGYFKRIKNGDYTEPNTYVNKVLNGEAAKDGDKQYLSLLEETEAYRSEHIIAYNSSILLLRNIHQLGLLWDISLEMEAQNKENNRFMLSQTALFLSQMIGDSDASFVFEKISAEVKHVMIDEFQDTSRLQWRNFKSLLFEILANKYFSLLVGDVKQSIYRWRNGDWSILNDLEKELPVTIKTLDKNYRSARRVVEFNNFFFVEAAQRLAVEVNLQFAAVVKDNPFETAYQKKLVEQTPIDLEEKGFVSIDFITKDKENDISYKSLVLAGIVEKLNDCRNAGISPNNICILTRTNKDIRDIAVYLALQKNTETELSEQGYLDIVSNDAFLLNASPALNIIIEALRLLVDWENNLPRVQLILMWKDFEQSYTGKLAGSDIHQSLSPAEFDNLLPQGFKEADFATLSLMPLYDLVLHIYQLFIQPVLDNVSDSSVKPDQSAYLYTFLDNLVQYLSTHVGNINSFITYWDEELNFKALPKKTDLVGIEAMTIHKSKGLQFHTVLLPFCDWDMAKYSNGQQKSIVWCKRKEPPFDLEILPVEYTRTMKDSFFSVEFAQETVQLWMDNLNVLYVAFTRAERNLCILSEPKESSKSFKVSDLLFSLAQQSQFGIFDAEKLRFSYGALDAQRSKQKDSENMLKNKSVVNEVPVMFLPNNAGKQSLVFVQSNQSRAFIHSEEDSTSTPYVKQGNIMHALFANVNTIADIENAVRQLIFDGLLAVDEGEKYIRLVYESIRAAGVENWFSGKYRLFNECLILLKDSVTGKVISCRPDRVMLSNDEVVIVDYKFGKSYESHFRQVKDYMHVLREMGYTSISGYLWYVTENRVVRVD
jgi:ATP-dependent exoDNAse (exonuclease V) beta subunit